MQIHPGCLAWLCCIYSASWHPFVDCLLCAAVLEVPGLGYTGADNTGRGSVLFNSSCEKTSLRGHLGKGHLSPRMSWVW